MKSLSHISRQPGRIRGDESPVALRLKHPLTDYHFHTADGVMKSGGSVQKLTRPLFAPGFRDLSNEFLGAETKRNYVAEVLFFAIIVGVSVWPIISMVYALAELVK
jgi:hypothetical protein